ncbi:hypothetical protein DRQ53_15715, partial [bacterium]
MKDGSTKVIQANVIPEVTGLVERRPINTKNFQYLSEHLELADSFPTATELTSIDLLIGMDQYYNFIDGERLQVDESLYLQGSKLGWILTGSMKATEESSDENMSMLVLSHFDHIETTQLLSVSGKTASDNESKIEDFWNLDVIGIKESIEDSDDEKAMEQFESTVKFHDGRYYVGWPWKSPLPELPENRELAYGRFQSLIRKTKDNPDLLIKMNSIVEEQE